MHDCVVDLSDDAVSVTRDARQKQAGNVLGRQNDWKRPDTDTRRERQFMHDITQDFSASHESAQSRQPYPDSLAKSGCNESQSLLGGFKIPGILKRSHVDQAVLIEEWRDRVRTLPEIRSALIPIDEMDEDIEWSSAFSLPKANLEPWLSFFEGYKQSSLFAGPARPLQDDACGEAPVLQLQFEVQAILSLRNLPAKVIMEPPVRISAPVVYLDLLAELATCSDPAQAQGLAKIANEVHESRLEQAVAKGREMGNRLYHVLLGADCTNLSREWQRIHRRKPSVDEIYNMLTTGGIKPLPVKRPPPPSSETQAMPRPARTAAASVKAPLVPDQVREKIEKKVEKNIEKSVETAERVPQYNAATTNRNAESVARKIIEETRKKNRIRKILLHLFQFTICCLGLVTHALAA